MKQPKKQNLLENKKRMLEKTDWELIRKYDKQDIVEWTSDGKLVKSNTTLFDKIKSCHIKDI